MTKNQPVLLQTNLKLQLVQFSIFKSSDFVELMKLKYSSEWLEKGCLATYGLVTTLFGNPK